MGIALDVLFAWFMFGLAALLSLDLVGKWDSPPPKNWRLVALMCGPISVYLVLKSVYRDVRDHLRGRIQK